MPPALNRPALQCFTVPLAMADPDPLLYEKARAEFPEVRVPQAAFAAALEARGSASARGAELYLCVGCEAGDAAALRAFDALYLSRIGSSVSRINPSPAFADEVRQRLRERLFVATPGSPARISSWSGAAPLEAWLRATAVRMALTLLRERGQPRNEPSFEEALQSSDPELSYLRDRYRGQCQEAFQAALASLSPRDRTLLRLRYLDGLSIDALAPLHGVHRATVARWVAASRSRLLEATRRELQARLGGSLTDLDSLLRLVRSDLVVNLRESQFRAN
jgi:RNA polymerase sigma-70 factor, ECF subfamily